MQKTLYQQNMDKLGLDEHDLFEFEFKKIIFFVNSLSVMYEKDDLLDERSLLLRSIRRMTRLMESIDVIYEYTQERASMMILTRSIIDINATICFLFKYVTDHTERTLRILLFFLDGIRTRMKLSDFPMKPRDERYISEDEYCAIFEQREATRSADMKAEKDILEMIEKSPLYPRMNHLIIEKANWRYRSLKSKGDYSWRDLYEMVCGDESWAMFEQVYLSQYVHGVAIADIQSDSIVETNPMFSLNMCNSTLKMLEQILKIWFSGEYENLENAYKQNVGPSLLMNLPQATISEYIQRYEENYKSKT